MKTVRKSSVASIFIVLLMPTLIACSSKAPDDYSSSSKADILVEAAAIAQTPVENYKSIDENCELMTFEYEFSGESGTLEFYVCPYDFEEIKDKYTLKKIAITNGRMITLKPKNSNGFPLKESEVIHLYVHLDMSPDYANKQGQTIQVGYSLDGVLYETFRGKLADDGVVYEITAPSSGEFMIFIINASIDMLNFSEITIQLSGA